MSNTNKNRNREFLNNSHRRLNPLTGEWVQVSPGRSNRPWQGQQETTESESPDYVQDCYLCPGNKRVGGAVNPDYDSTFVFENDFAALKPGSGHGVYQEKNLLVAKEENGICRVLCYHPKHNLTLSRMSIEQVEAVVRLWRDQYQELSEMPSINWVQIIENKGEVMGCSNPHPHGQIWAQESIPDEPSKELKTQSKYYKSHGTTLLGDYISLEIEKKERVVIENEDFIVVVPFWAFWPFETLLVSRRPFGRFTDMTDSETGSLADIIRRLTIRYDNIFNVSFPYSAGFHPAPTDGKEHEEWHFHMHFYPPLLRSARVKKFRAGYEMLATPQRDHSPEWAAEILRNLSDIHYHFDNFNSTSNSHN